MVNLRSIRLCSSLYWLTLWEFSTAKTGWLPKPFFSAPTGLLHVYVTDWQRLLLCIGYSLRLWGLGFCLGAVLGYVAGVALGWSKPFAHWGMPILKLIGPVPATAWIPVIFYLLPTMFDASVFIVALASGIPVTILTSSGVASVDRGGACRGSFTSSRRLKRVNASRVTSAEG